MSVGQVDQPKPTQNDVNPDDSGQNQWKDFFGRTTVELDPNGEKLLAEFHNAASEAYRLTYAEDRPQYKGDGGPDSNPVLYPGYDVDLPSSREVWQLDDPRVQQLYANAGINLDSVDLKHLVVTNRGFDPTIPETVQGLVHADSFNHIFRLPRDVTAARGLSAVQDRFRVWPKASIHVDRTTAFGHGIGNASIGVSAELVYVGDDGLYYPVYSTQFIDPERNYDIGGRKITYSVDSREPSRFQKSNDGTEVIISQHPGHWGSMKNAKKRSLLTGLSLDYILFTGRDQEEFRDMKVNRLEAGHDIPVTDGFPHQTYLAQVGLQQLATAANVPSACASFLNLPCSTQ